MSRTAIATLAALLSGEALAGEPGTVSIVDPASGSATQPEGEVLRFHAVDLAERDLQICFDVPVAEGGRQRQADAPELWVTLGASEPSGCAAPVKKGDGADGVEHLCWTISQRGMECGVFEALMGGRDARFELKDDPGSATVISPRRPVSLAPRTAYVTPGSELPISFDLPGFAEGKELLLDVAFWVEGESPVWRRARLGLKGTRATLTGQPGSHAAQLLASWRDDALSSKLHLRMQVTPGAPEFETVLRRGVQLNQGRSILSLVDLAHAHGEVLKAEGGTVKRHDQPDLCRVSPDDTTLFCRDLPEAGVNVVTEEDGVQKTYQIVPKAPTVTVAMKALVHVDPDSKQAWIEAPGAVEGSDAAFHWKGSGGDWLLADIDKDQRLAPEAGYEGPLNAWLQSFLESASPGPAEWQLHVRVKAGELGELAYVLTPETKRGETAYVAPEAPKDWCEAVAKKHGYNADDKDKPYLLCFTATEREVLSYVADPSSALFPAPNQPLLVLVKYDPSRVDVDVRAGGTPQIEEISEEPVSGRGVTIKSEVLDASPPPSAQLRVTSWLFAPRKPNDLIEVKVTVTPVKKADPPRANPGSMVELLVPKLYASAIRTGVTLAYIPGGAGYFYSSGDSDTGTLWRSRMTVVPELTVSAVAYLQERSRAMPRLPSDKVCLQKKCPVENWGRRLGVSLGLGVLAPDLSSGDSVAVDFLRTAYLGMEYQFIPGFSLAGVVGFRGRYTVPDGYAEGMELKESEWKSIRQHDVRPVFGVQLNVPPAFFEFAAGFPAKLGKDREDR